NRAACVNGRRCTPPCDYRGQRRGRRGRRSRSLARGSSDLDSAYIAAELASYSDVTGPHAFLRTWYDERSVFHWRDPHRSVSNGLLLRGVSPLRQSSRRKLRRWRCVGHSPTLIP